jgi:endonuclease/exonuclease/phosphatase family metal-dependent hydrolase
MKKEWSLASSVLALLLGTSISAGELTIATFNAEFLTRPKVHIKFDFPFQLEGADQQQWDAPGFRDQKFKEAAKAVARVIAGVSADVVALTEVGNRQDVLELVKEIEQLGLRYEHIAVCNCTDHTTQQHVAVLSKLQLSEVLTSISGRESYDRELDDPETEDDTGLGKSLRVTFQAEGRKFNLYVVHLASERKHHEQDAQRIAQASIIRRHYLPLLNDGEHVMVAGDLNDHRGQPALRRMRGRDDIWEDLIQTGQTGKSGRPSFFAQGEESSRWTYEFRGLRHQVDHILLSPSIERVSRKISARVVEQNDQIASDHRPLVVTLDLR